MAVQGNAIGKTSFALLVITVGLTGSFVIVLTASQSATRTGTTIQSRSTTFPCTDDKICDGASHGQITTAKVTSSSRSTYPCPTIPGLSAIRFSNGTVVCEPGPPFAVGDGVVDFRNGTRVRVNAVGVHASANTTKGIVLVCTNGTLITVTARGVSSVISPTILRANVIPHGNGTLIAPEGTAYTVPPETATAVIFHVDRNSNLSGAFATDSPIIDSFLPQNSWDPSATGFLGPGHPSNYGSFSLTPGLYYWVFYNLGSSTATITVVKSIILS